VTCRNATPPWQTVYTRFRRYALDGLFIRALQQIQAQADAAGGIDEERHGQQRRCSPPDASASSTASPT
jgi:hypothetical protein